MIIEQAKSTNPKEAVPVEIETKEDVPQKTYESSLASPCREPKLLSGHIC